MQSWQSSAYLLTLLSRESKSILDQSTLLPIIASCPPDCCDRTYSCSWAMVNPMYVSLCFFFPNTRSHLVDLVISTPKNLWIRLLNIKSFLCCSCDLKKFFFLYLDPQRTFNSNKKTCSCFHNSTQQRRLQEEKHTKVLIDFLSSSLPSFFYLKFIDSLFVSSSQNCQN